MIVLLLVMVALSPSPWNSHPAAVADVAEAIEHATGDAMEQAALASVSFHETTWGGAGVPFGLSCCYRRGMTLDEAATRSLGILRTGLARCGRWERAFGFYHSGACGTGQYERAESAMQVRMAGALVMTRLRRWW